MKYIIKYDDCNTNQFRLVDAKSKTDALKVVCDYVYYKNNSDNSVYGICSGHNKKYYATRLKAELCFQSNKNHFVVVQPYNLFTDEEIFYKFDLDGIYLKHKVI